MKPLPITIRFVPAVPPFWNHPALKLHKLLCAQHGNPLAIAVSSLNLLPHIDVNVNSRSLAERDPQDTATDHSMKELVEYWNKLNPLGNHDSLPKPLGMPQRMFRQESRDNYRDVRWQQLMSGDPSSQLNLSLKQSELDLMNAPNHQDMEILRTWDVDSFLARATNLAVHRGGFNLAYRPPYLCRITQNPRVTFNNGLNVHKTKQLRIGRGLAAGGFGYECHVIFPNMTLGQTENTHLDDAQQTVWINDIICPALRKVCPAYVMQHHPRSFNDAARKAVVKKEKHPTGSDAAIDLHYCVPEQYLRSFWKEVILLCDRHDQYKQPVLIVSGHNLKLHTTKLDPIITRRTFLNHLNVCFRFEERYIPTEDCWLDFGMEDTPSNVSGVTLMRSTDCLSSWISLFDCPASSRSRTQYQRFQWNMTRDLGSASVELRPTNILRMKGGIAYNKSYNLHKDLFATPMKDIHPFGFNQLEGLGYSPDLLNRYFSTSRKFAALNTVRKRSQLLNVYIMIKTRVAEALRSSMQTNFGVRQEYRINLALFQALELNNSLDPTTLDVDNSHRSYMQFSTSDLNRFLAASLNRWMFCLEAHICQVDHGSDGLLPISQEQQLVNSSMISALIRIMRISLGDDDFVIKRSIMLHRWSSKSRAVPTVGEREEVQDEESERDEEDDDDEAAENNVRRNTRRGLNLQNSIQEHGLPWLPVEYVLWNELPIFTPQLSNRLALSHNALQATLLTPGIQRAITTEERVFTAFRKHVQRAKEMKIAGLKDDGRDPLIASIYIASSLVIRSYICRIKDILDSRMLQAGRRGLKIPTSQPWVQEDLKGLTGLAYVQLKEHYYPNQAPHVIKIKAITSQPESRFGRAHFHEYNTGMWIDKVGALFALDDIETTKQRGWEQELWRRQTRRLRDILVEETGANNGPMFIKHLITIAAKKLWIIPAYDIDKLSCLAKSSKHNSNSTASRIRQATDLDRTSWTVPQLHASFFDQLRLLERHWTPNLGALPAAQRSKLQAAHKAISDEVCKTSLKVLFEGGGYKDSGLIKNPKWFGFNPEPVIGNVFLRTMVKRLVQDEPTDELNPAEMQDSISQERTSINPRRKQRITIDISSDSSNSDDPSAATLVSE